MEKAQGPPCWLVGVENDKLIQIVFLGPGIWHVTIQQAGSSKVGFLTFWEPLRKTMLVNPEKSQLLFPGFG